jgi:hypothetical protein
MHYADRSLEVETHMRFNLTRDGWKLCVIREGSSIIGTFIQRFVKNTTSNSTAILETLGKINYGKVTHCFLMRAVNGEHNFV